MKRLNDISIRITLPSVIGLVTFLALAIGTIVLMVNSRKNQLETASKIAQLSAQNAGQQLAEKINSAGSVARAFSGILKNIVTSGIIPEEKKRELIKQQIEDLLRRESRLTNIWCFMEPDKLGMDSLFVGIPGNNERGNFGSWFFKDDNNNIGLLSVSDPYNEVYYQAAKKNKKEVITEPYWEGEVWKVYMFSIAVPVMVGQECIGVVGTDFDVTQMQKLLNDIDGETLDGKLVTNKGIIAIHYDAGQVGEIAEYGNREILDKLSGGKQFEGMYSVNGIEHYKVYVPIKLGEGGAPWYYAVDVPKAAIYKQANQAIVYLAVANLIVMIVIIFVVWMIARALLKGVVDITEVIRRLSLGIIDIRLQPNRDENEMGQINQALISLIDGLKRTSCFARDIGEGRLDAEYQPLSDQDVLGNSLIEMRCNLQQVKTEQEYQKIEEDHRNWSTSGLAMFGEILRQDNDNLDALSFNIISNLVKYTNANQGGIFILNDDTADQFLEMKACVAYNRRKYAEKKILPGEGLVGTCFIEAQSIYMTEIPQNYITITSGLGEETPRALLITPLKLNEKIFGVIEMASFVPFEDYQREFVEKLSESIAATISSVGINIRTNKLLVQTKLQTEEMINQEEELRQNMEEMQTTQEEMRRREAELSEALGQMTEVQKQSENKDYEMQQLYQFIVTSFNVVECSPDGLIVKINRNVIELFEAVREENFIGRPLSDFIMLSKEEVNIFWKELCKGNMYENTADVITGENKTTKMSQKFVPIVDADGIVQRILLIAYPLVTS